MTSQVTDNCNSTTVELRYRTKTVNYMSMTGMSKVNLNPDVNYST